MRFTFLILSAIGVALLLSSVGCKSDTSSHVQSNDISIRVRSEPDNLNPTRSRSSVATPIENLILLPIAEFDPYTFDLTPLLVESRARIEDIDDGPFAGGQKFHYIIREEAVWDNGSPITGHDYAFTLKAILNPKVEAARWRGYLTFIEDVEVDPTNPKKFAAIVSEKYMLAEVVTCNFNLFPKYVYDPAGYLDDLTVAELSDDARAEELVNSDPNLEAFAQSFRSVGYNRDTVEGAGPYKLVEWISGQQIVLERKANWWGDQVEDAPEMLHAYPQKISYKIIPDETAAMAALKDGSVDIMSQVTAPNFVRMRDDSRWQSEFDFFTPDLLQYRCLEINNRHKILQDVNVRRALAYAVDYDAILTNVELGTATRTVGPFAISKEYYNDTLDVINQNLEFARKLLVDAGWDDTNSNGILDKVIEGQRTELELDILVSQSAAGQQVALLVKESAAKVGIEIDINTQDANARRQVVSKREFEILPTQASTSPALNDPYQFWHSESDQPGGGNRTGYRNPEADVMIDRIRLAETSEERNDYYRQLQELLYETQPVIFLYIPVQRIIASKRLNVKPSSRRPGYFENLFTLSDS